MRLRPDPTSVDQSNVTAPVLAAEGAVAAEAEAEELRRLALAVDPM